MLTPQHRFRNILQKSIFIQPVEDIKKDLYLDHYGAANGGHAAQVSCEWYCEQEKIISFVEKKTELTGWIMTLEQPTFTKGRYTWILIRP